MPCFSVRRRLYLAAVLSSTLLAAAPLQAHIATTIDFENVPDTTPAPSFLQLSEAPASSYVSDQLLGQFGVRLRSDDPGLAAVALVQLGFGHASSGEFGVGSIDALSRIDYGIPLVANFFLPGDPTTPAVTDTVAIHGDQFTCCETLTIEAYGFSGDLLASTSVNASDSLMLEVSHAGIHSVRVLQESSSVAWDDLAFGELIAVPEPSALALGAFATLSAAAIARAKRRDSA